MASGWLISHPFEEFGTIVIIIPNGGSKMKRLSV
jgi:hypothetical protein